MTSLPVVAINIFIKTNKNHVILQILLEGICAFKFELKTT